MSPLPSDCIEQVYSQEGPLQNTTTHLVLEKKSGFNYRSLLGELMYTYITCRQDIDYAVTTLIVKIFIGTVRISLLRVIERCC